MEPTELVTLVLTMTVRREDADFVKEAMAEAAGCDADAVYSTTERGPTVGEVEAFMREYEGLDG